MKRLVGVVVILFILLAGGGLTAQFIANNGAAPLPVLQQTSNPEGSVSELVPWQTEQLFLFIGFILFNLIGIAVTIAVIMWLLDRGVRHSRAEAKTSAADSKGQSPAPAQE